MKIPLKWISKNNPYLSYKKRGKIEQEKRSKLEEDFKKLYGKYPNKIELEQSKRFLSQRKFIVKWADHQKLKKKKLP